MGAATIGCVTLGRISPPGGTLMAAGGGFLAHLPGGALTGTSTGTPSGTLCDSTGGGFLMITGGALVGSFIAGGLLKEIP